MTTYKKILLPTYGPSEITAVEVSDAVVSKYSTTGMFTVQTRDGIAARRYTLKWNNASSTVRDEVETVYTNTTGGTEFFGMVPPPASAAFVPRVMGGNLGAFSANWKLYQNAQVPWNDFVDHPGTVTYGAYGAALTTSSPATSSNYAGLELANFCLPNLIYRLDYRLNSAGVTQRLGIPGTWIQDLPSTGTFTQSISQGTTGVDDHDGLISLDLTADTDLSLYFSIPEYDLPVAVSAGIPGFTASQFVIASAGAGSGTTWVESAALYQVGSLFRFNKFTVQRRSNAAYDIEAVVEETVASHASSKVSNRQ